MNRSRLTMGAMAAACALAAAGPAGGKPAPPPAPQTASPATPRVASLANNVWALDRALIAELGRAVQLGKITAVREPRGYGLSTLGEPGRGLGLESGDVIVSIQGIALTGPAAIKQAYALAAGAAWIAVALRRDGTPVTLLYRTVPDVREVIRAQAELGARAVALMTALTDYRPGAHRYARQALRAALARPVAPPPGADGTSSSYRYEISRSLVDKALADPAAAAGGARIVPSIKSGRANGFKIYAIRPGSIYAKLGLQNGDTVHSINHFALTSADKALAAYTYLKKADKLDVRLTRRGKLVTITIVIR